MNQESRIIRASYVNSRLSVEGEYSIIESQLSLSTWG